MIDTIVTASSQTAQLFALIAVIVFIVSGVIAFMEKSFYSVAICAGLVFLSLSALYAGGVL